jgi:hypothetical protein
MTPTDNLGVGLDVTGTPWHDAGGAPFKRQHLARQGQAYTWDYKAPLCGDVHDGKKCLG